MKVYLNKLENIITLQINENKRTFLSSPQKIKVVIDELNALYANGDVKIITPGEKYEFVGMIPFKFYGILGEEVKLD